jgi:hypothetical protein
MRSARTLVFASGLMFFAACPTYKSKPQLNYYHGPNVPEGYITVLRASAGEIEFRIRVHFASKKVYHLILEDNIPAAEGWFSANAAGGALRASIFSEHAPEQIDRLLGGLKRLA